jgi:biotin carboxyl carrier protein
LSVAPGKGIELLKLQIKIDGKTYAAEVEVLDEDASQPAYAPYVPPPAASQPAPAPQAFAAAHTTAGNAQDDKQYRSPVTGLVIRVNGRSGQAVEPGDVIMVLEAMKMETSIVARCAGIVKCINVAPGNPVKLHQVLLELE